LLDTDTKRRIDTARDILVGKVPDPKSQLEQITIALIYKFMDDMDAESEELGGKRKFFTGEYARYGWAKLMAPRLVVTRCSGSTAKAFPRWVTSKKDFPFRLAVLCRTRMVQDLLGHTE